MRRTRTRTRTRTRMSPPLPSRALMRAKGLLVKRNPTQAPRRITKNRPVKNGWVEERVLEPW